MVKVLGRFFMGFILLSFFTNCNFSTSNKETNKKIRFTNLKEVIKESFEIEDRLDADFNQDGRNDEILILRYNSSNRRSLVICIKESDDEFSLNVLSSMAVANKKDDNSLDPYKGIWTEKGDFTLKHIAPNQFSDSIEHTFSYDPISKLFFLTKITKYQCDKKTVLTDKDFGEVNVFDYNILTEY